MQLLERLTVVYEQHARERPPVLGLPMTVPIFMGHGDVRPVADVLLELET